MDGDAVRKTIGKPDLPFWEVFFRETVQNSWDARIEDSIDFGIQAITFGPVELEVLRGQVFAEIPPDRTDLQSLLANGPLRALIVRDSGTKGLGGNARADEVAAEGEPTDFRSFAFNVGRDPDRKAGGGTYGFGKAVLYTASRVRTCLVYTRTRWGDQMLDRFIVTTVASRFQHEGKIFTGRHWWGVLDEPAVLPLEGDGALQLATKLGMTTVGGGTGTTIAVLDPSEPGVADDSDLGAALDGVRSAALKWAWPHLVESSGDSSIRFSFVYEGESRPISIDEDPEILQFAAAYREALVAIADSTSEISWQVTIPRIPIDVAVAKTGVLAVRRALQIDDVSYELNNKVALMRNPRFIVKYLQIDPDPQGQYVAGVFIADPELDSTFAAQEPVTHDSWASEASRSKYRPVAWTLRDIRNATRVAPPSAEAAASEVAVGGIAHLSRVLGESLMGFARLGPERRPRLAPAPRVPRADFSVRVGDEPTLVGVDGSRVIVDFPIEVRSRTGADLSPWRALATPTIAAEGGRTESGSAVEPELVEVVGWFAGDQRVASEREVEALSVHLHSRLTVRLSHSPHVAVGVRVSKRKVQ
ncbi:hypothetical protein [Microbacterium sp. P5_E9]